MVCPDTDPVRVAEFEGFVRGSEPRLRRALVAAYGFEDGRDATAEALPYAWEHWERTGDAERNRLSSPGRAKPTQAAAAWCTKCRWS